MSIVEDKGISPLRPRHAELQVHWQWAPATPERGLKYVCTWQSTSEGAWEILRTLQHFHKLQIGKGIFTGAYVERMSHRTKKLESGRQQPSTTHNGV